MYDYKEEITIDIKDYLRRHYTNEELATALEKNDFDDIFEKLQDDLWICDSVTGSASGSYTFNSWTAREYVTANMDLLKEALTEFCVEAETIAEKFLNDEWEYFDVTIRCYLLNQVLYDVLNELNNELVRDKGE